jgi:hypothetical protein
MALDLAADLERIARHIPCLERAAQDESAPAEVRAAVAAMAQLARSAAEAIGKHRPPADNAEHPRTETTPHD